MPGTKESTATRITEAAVQLFARQGFHGTSTREIARLADVNEATLFRYFRTKTDLFWASVEGRFSSMRIRRELRAAMIAGGNPTTVVPMIIEFLVNVMLYQPELTRLLSFGVLELESGAETVCRTHVTPLFQEIQTYLLRSIAKREIAEVDAGVGGCGHSRKRAGTPSGLRIGGGKQIAVGDTRPNSQPVYEVLAICSTSYRNSIHAVQYGAVTRTSKVNLNQHAFRHRREILKHNGNRIA